MRGLQLESCGFCAALRIEGDQTCKDSLTLFEEQPLIFDSKHPMFIQKRSYGTNCKTEPEFPLSLNMAMIKPNVWWYNTRFTVCKNKTRPSRRDMKQDSPKNETANNSAITREDYGVLCQR